MNSANCKLCNQPRVLRESHIISRFFIKPIGASTGGKFVVLNPGPSTAREGQDKYKEHLLCEQCEGDFKVYEDYVKDFIVCPHKVGVTITDTSSHRYFEGIDYHKLKLFQLSILWRASITNHESFSLVKLSPNRNEFLRKRLYHAIPCNPEIYGCRMRLLYDEHGGFPVHEMVAFPARTKGNLQPKYMFVFGGFSWEFHIPVVNNENFTKEEYLVTSEGKMCIPKISIYKHPLLARLLSSAGKSEPKGALARKIEEERNVL